jgi:hypothetical protein
MFQYQIKKQLSEEYFVDVVAVIDGDEMFSEHVFFVFVKDSK